MRRLGCATASLALALLATTADAAPLRGVTLYNGIDADVVSLRLRKGSVTGFQPLPPGYGIVVRVEMQDGSCSGWLVARTRYGDAAQALIDVCGGGIYAVTVKNGEGTALDLAIKPVR